MLYRFLQILFRIGLRLFVTCRIEGLGNMPSSGPVILASNHLSNYDPIILTAACPRPIRYLAKVELFRIPLLSTLLRRVGTIPIRRGSSDRTAISKAVQALRTGEVIGIFVEGTRNPNAELLPFHNGAAMLAYRTNALLVPVVLKIRKREIRVIFGEPITPEPASNASRKEHYALLNTHLSEAFNRLLMISVHGEAIP